MKATKPVITICSSAAFYKHVTDLRDQLETMGFQVLIPEMADQMKTNNDYEVTHYKSWLIGSGEYDKKAKFMRGHFDKVAEGDAILVVNDQKHGIDNYIGGNVLMEMSLAFYLRKSIFILNDFPAESAYDEELRGFLPTLLGGDITKLPAVYDGVANAPKP